MATLVSSAGGLLAMLNKPRPELKYHALSNLIKIVDGFWPEISTSVPIMYEIDKVTAGQRLDLNLERGESLYEDEEVGEHQRQLAALLVSKVLRPLVRVYQKLPSPDYLSICQCLMFLYEPEIVASILEKLLRSENKDDALLAYQIAFNLFENEHQDFLLNARNRLSAPKTQPSEPVQPESTEVAQNEDSAAGDVQMTDESSAANVTEPEDPKEVMYSERLTKIKRILSGETPIQLKLQFLYSHNKCRSSLQL